MKEVSEKDFVINLALNIKSLDQDFLLGIVKKGISAKQQREMSKPGEWLGQARGGKGVR